MACGDHKTFKEVKVAGIILYYTVPVLEIWIKVDKKSFGTYKTFYYIGLNRTPLLL